MGFLNFLFGKSKTDKETEKRHAEIEKCKSEQKSFLEIVSSLRPELLQLGWYVQITNRIITLHKYFKNGKPMKGYVLGLAEVIPEAESSASLRLSMQPKVDVQTGEIEGPIFGTPKVEVIRKSRVCKPRYSVAGYLDRKGEGVPEWSTELEKMVDSFMKLAKKYAPIKKGE